MPHRLDGSRSSNMKGPFYFRFPCIEYANFRSFDFSQCHSYVPQWQSAPRDYELAIMVKITQWLAAFLNQFGPIQQLGRQYYDEGLLGSLVRLVMDPPCPNPQSEIVSPFFSKTLKRTPATLRVRVRTLKYEYCSSDPGQ